MAGAAANDPRRLTYSPPSSATSPRFGAGRIELDQERLSHRLLSPQICTVSRERAAAAVVTRRAANACSANSIACWWPLGRLFIAFHPCRNRSFLYFSYFQGLTPHYPVEAVSRSMTCFDEIAGGGLGEVVVEALEDLVDLLSVYWTPGSSLAEPAQHRSPVLCSASVSPSPVLVRPQLSGPSLFSPHARFLEERFEIGARIRRCLLRGLLLRLRLRS